MALQTTVEFLLFVFAGSIPTSIAEGPSGIVTYEIALSSRSSFFSPRMILEQDVDIILIYARHFSRDLNLVVGFADVDFWGRRHLPEHGTKGARQPKPVKDVVEETVHFAAHCQKGIILLAPRAID
jgi:hypothetical protein